MSDGTNSIQGRTDMRRREQNALILRKDKELLRIEAWGRDSFRVRATQRSMFLR